MEKLLKNPKSASKPEQQGEAPPPPHAPTSLGCRPRARLPRPIALTSPARCKTDVGTPRYGKGGKNGAKRGDFGEKGGVLRRLLQSFSEELIGAVVVLEDGQHHFLHLRAGGEKDGGEKRHFQPQNELRGQPPPAPKSSPVPPLPVGHQLQDL